MSDKRRTDAAALSNSLQDVLVVPKEREPSSWKSRPVDWAALKRKATAERKAKRAASKPAPKPPRIGR
jgi:hypothetical protein